MRVGTGECDPCMQLLPSPQQPREARGQGESIGTFGLKPVIGKDWQLKTNFGENMPGLTAFVGKVSQVPGGR